MSGANSIDFDGLLGGEEHLVAKEIANLWSTWDGARSGIKKLWAETLAYKYATTTHETLNGDMGMDVDVAEDEEGGGGHSTHIPKISEISDNLAAIYMDTVYPSEDFFQFIGEDAESSKKETRRKIESYLTTKHRASKLRLTIQKIIEDFVDYGNCFSRVTYVNQTTLPSYIGGRVTRGYKGPKVERISPLDIVFNPLATDFESAPKVVRSIKSMGELMRDAEESPQLGYSKDAIALAQKLRATCNSVGGNDFDKHVQLMVDGFGSASQYLNSGNVEILEFFGDYYDTHTDVFYKNQVITVMDRTYVLRSEPLNTWSGRPPIQHAGWRNRKNNLWAMGALDNLIGMQYLINHLENSRADGFDQMLEPTRVEVGSVRNIDAESGKPGGVYRIDEAEGKVFNLMPDTTVLTANNDIQMKLHQMELFAGMPNQEKGFSSPGEQTLGEVNHLSRSANKIFRSKIATFEVLLEDILKAELECAKDINDLDDIAATVGEDGVKLFESITREDLNVNGNLVPMGSKHFDRRNQLIQNISQIQQLLSQDPMALQHLSSYELARMYSELMELDKTSAVQKWVRVAEQSEMMQMQSAAQQQGEANDMVSLEDPGGGDEDEFEE